MGVVINKRNIKIFQESFLVRLRERKRWLLYFTIFWLVLYLFYERSIGVISTIFFFIVLFSGYSVILSFSNQWHRNAVILILSFGIVFSIATPMFDVLDETVHFARTAYISEGHFGLSDEGDYFIASAAQEKLSKHSLDAEPYSWNEMMKIPYDTAEKGNYPSIQGTSGYSFLSYAIPAFGIFLMSLLKLPLAIVFIFGRILNVCVYAFLVYWAIKITPLFKHMFFAVGCLPLVITLVASYNQDSYALGLGLIVIAYFLKLYYQEENISLKQQLFFYVFCSLMIITKMPYVLLCGLLFFIPKNKFEKKKNYFYNGFFILILAILTLLWFYQTMVYPSPYSPDGVDAIAQIKYILSNPLQIIAMIFDFIINNFCNLSFLTIFGWVPYSMGASFPYSMGALYPMFMFFIGALAVFYPKEQRIDHQSIKIGVLLVLVAIFSLIVLSLYITWTPVGANVLQGVQGRYFVQLLLFIPILLNCGSLFSELPAGVEVKYQNIVCNVVLYFLLVAFTLTMSRYYF